MCTAMGRTYRKRKRLKHRRVHTCLCRDFIDLFKWIKANVNKLIPATFDDTGRGLMTKKPISAGETIISIPNSFLITMETVINSDVGNWIRSSTNTVRLNLQQAMSIFLIIENRKQQNSTWWPYIKVLPMTFDTPSFWKSCDIDLFSYNLFKRIKKDLKDFQTFYEEVLCFLTNHDFDISYEEFRWAWYCINSRSIYYVNDGSPYLQDRNKNIALAPILDLLNHSTSAVVEAGFNRTNNCYEIKTFNTYKKYDQIFISYGPHSNTHLLFEYGFILPDNPHDVYEISLDIIKKAADRLYLQHIDRKIEIITENNLDKKLVCSLEGISWNLQSVLRIFAMDFTELKSWKEVFKGGIISVNNQQRILQIGKIILQEELDQVRSCFDKFPSKEYSKLTMNQKIAYDLTKIEENILQKSINLL